MHNSEYKLVRKFNQSHTLFGYQSSRSCLDQPGWLFLDTQVLQEGRFLLMTSNPELDFFIYKLEFIIPGDQTGFLVISSRNWLYIKQQMTCIEQFWGLRAQIIGGDANRLTKCVGLERGQQPGHLRGPNCSTTQHGAPWEPGAVYIWLQMVHLSPYLSSHHMFKARTVSGQQRKGMRKINHVRSTLIGALPKGCTRCWLKDGDVGHPLCWPFQLVLRTCNNLYKVPDRGPGTQTIQSLAWADLWKTLRREKKENLR